jgi:hypothetical protein
MDYPGKLIKKGEINKEIVMAIQMRLNEMGFGLVEVDGDFGKSTESAVKLFQSQTRDLEGNPLVVDGKLGPISWAVLFAGKGILPQPKPQKHPLLLKALEIAASQIGVLEDPPGSNRGVMVEKYLASAGCVPGDPWCASFVYWCFNEAAKSLNVNNPLTRTGGCLSHWTRTKGGKISCLNATNNASLIQPGFIFIMDHGRGKGHTGIVKSVSDGYIQTIEGNTNIEGSREGLGVAELKRKINTISAGFIDYSS